MLGQIIVGASRGQVRSFEAEQQDRGGAQHWQAREGRTRSNRVWWIETEQQIKPQLQLPLRLQLLLQLQLQQLTKFEFGGLYFVAA